MIEPIQYPLPISQQDKDGIIVNKINEIIEQLNHSSVPIENRAWGYDYIKAGSKACNHLDSYSLNRNGNWRCKQCKKIFKKS